MAYITYVGKYVTCPKWNLRVRLNGKYIYSDEDNQGNMAKFINATCPIIENSKQSPEKQCSEFFLLRCPEMPLGCSLLKDFKPIIDVSVDDYLQ